MIIDGHIHLIPKAFNENHTKIFFDISELDKWLTQTPNSKAVVMTTIIQYCDSIKINKEFLSTIESFQKKKQIFPFLWIHPDQLIEEHFKIFSFSGFKFHPSISQQQIDTNERILKLCEKYKKPILIHCGRNEKSRIDYILNINEYYPDLFFICAHLGGLATDLIIRSFEKIKNANYKDNIYMDTSGCFSPNLIEKAIELLGNDKIIFGSDRPFHDYLVSLYALKLCNFDKKVLDKILYNNILNILGK